MSLSTQLTRGTLALPMLALFGLLALAADRCSEAQGAVGPTTHTVRMHVVEAGSSVCLLQLRTPMLLAQAPADLGPLAQRALHNNLAASCRA